MLLLVPLVLGADIECKTDTNIEISIDVWNDSNTNITYVNVTVDTPDRDKVYTNLTSGTDINKEVLNVDFTGNANFNDTVVSNIVNQTCADVKTHFGNLQTCELDKGRIQGELNNCNATYSLISIEKEIVKNENAYLKTLPIQYPEQNTSSSSDDSSLLTWIAAAIFILAAVVFVWYFVKKSRSPAEYYGGSAPGSPSTVTPNPSLSREDMAVKAIMEKFGGQIKK